MTIVINQKKIVKSAIMSISDLLPPPAVVVLIACAGGSADATI